MVSAVTPRSESPGASSASSVERRRSAEHSQISRDDTQVLRRNQNDSRMSCKFHSGDTRVSCEHRRAQNWSSMTYDGDCSMAGYGGRGQGGREMPPARPG